MSLQTGLTTNGGLVGQALQDFWQTFLTSSFDAHSAFRMSHNGDSSAQSGGGLLSTGALVDDFGLQVPQVIGHMALMPAELQRSFMDEQAAFLSAQTDGSLLT